MARPRQPAGDRAAHLLVQQPAWGLPCQGLGVRREFDPDLIVPNPRSVGARRGARTLGDQQLRQLDAHNPARSLPQLRHSGQRALARAKRQAAGTSAVRLRQSILVEHHRDDGSHFSFTTQFEGVLNSIARRHRETYIRLHARQVRGVHERAPVRHVQRQPSAPRSPGRDRRRSPDPRGDRAAGEGPAALGAVIAQHRPGRLGTRCSRRAICTSPEFSRRSRRRRSSWSTWGWIT